MTRVHIVFLVGALCCASVVQAAEDGFALLFGSEGLRGWKVSDWSDLRTPQKVKGTPWKLEDGVLHGLNKRTWIMSPGQYGDFVLKLESKITRGSNGGIGLRFPPEGDPAYKAMEIQVVDHEVYYRGRSLPKQRTGSIYDEIAPSKDVVKPVGQWNSWQITARGSRVQIVLNGEKIIDVDLSRETKARQQKGPALAERPLKGHIGFQNLNGSITLRNVRIKELPGSNPPPEMVAKEAEGFRLLYNGLDLRGWKNVPGHEGHWRAKNRVLDYDGKSQAKDKHLLELELSDVETPDYVWLVYAVCACEKDSCGWGGWMIEAVFKKTEKQYSNATGDKILPAIMDQVCSKCGKTTFRTGASIRMIPSEDQKQRSFECEIIPMEYED